MSRTFPSFLVFLLVCVSAVFLESSRALAQTAQAAVSVEPKLTVEVESYCSETKLRTSNARIRWSMPKESLAAHKIAALAGSRQSLEATVYRDGFEKGLLVSVPLTQASPEKPLAALIEEKKPKLRAFQFSVIAIEQSKERVADEIGVSTMGAVVEGLEPGVNYTWRIAIQSDGGRIASAPATSRASICPADMAGEKPAPKPAPRSKP